MDSLSKDLVLITLQFLDEEKYKNTVHTLEQESGLYFNMSYFEEMVLAGDWDEVEKYLSGFTKVEDNRYSTKVYFELRKQKFFEALDRKDKPRALDILVNDLKVFSTSNEDLYKELTQLLTLENFRENEQLSTYGDNKEARSKLMIELKKVIEANPLFHDKLVFPSVSSSRLRTLINQSLNWQHHLCQNPRSHPHLNTLFTDHLCGSSNGVFATSSVSIPASAGAKPAGYVPLGIHAPFPNTASSNPNASAGWASNAATALSLQPAVVSSSNLPIIPNQVLGIKRPITPPVTLGLLEYHTADHEQLLKRLRTAPPVEEVTYPAVGQQSSRSLNILPCKVALTLQGTSSVTSMDFHPFFHTLLLVGYGNGEVTLWEITTREKVVSKPFEIWNEAACSAVFQAFGGKDVPISVNRVTWSPDGKYLGAAFDKHVIQVYAYSGAKELIPYLEIDAHVGGVNDLAFTPVNKQLCVVTCGDDKLIQVWSMLGRKLFTFEGHDAPVYSICLHKKRNVQVIYDNLTHTLKFLADGGIVRLSFYDRSGELSFKAAFIFSTATDGKIKVWLYDNMVSRVEYDAPGGWCTKMLYNADGTRLFSCGTSKEGTAFLVEWNEIEGTVKTTYSGFKRKSAGVVQFDTTQNHFLAAGEDNQIKFWHANCQILLGSIDADGGLPNLPYLKFNKEGNLLAVTTTENGIKILANEAGFRSLERSLPFWPGATLNGFDALGKRKEISNSVADVVNKTKPRQLTQVIDPIRCRLVTMNTSEAGVKVSRLLYTNSGTGILVLGSSGIQNLWKWASDEQNPSGKATAKAVPLLWKPNSGIVMANHVAGVNLKEAFPCIALSKKDSYILSACGGKISLFNMITFKVITTFMPPSISTSLAFHPQDNNIVAVGTDNSTIYIYNVRAEEEKSILRGHRKRVTALAFSTNLNILISSGADAHICIWSTDTWEKRRSFSLQLPAGELSSGDARVQFYSDQVHFLVSHETQLALYDATNEDCIQQWIPQDFHSAPISYATLSCNSQLIYATFFDGNIGIFDANSLILKCRLSRSLYLSQLAKGSQVIHPEVVASHPQDPYQFAIGFTDGSVRVIEPTEPEDKWEVTQPANEGFAHDETASTSRSNRADRQVQE